MHFVYAPLARACMLFRHQWLLYRVGHGISLEASIIPWRISSIMLHSF